MVNNDYCRKKLKLCLLTLQEFGEMIQVIQIFAQYGLYTKFILIRKLKNDPSFLEVKGNGFQSKSYIHVDDIFNGIMTVLDNKNDKKKYEVFNLATNDYITVKEIVSAILNSLELSETTKVVYGNTSGGWLGDVPVVRFDTSKIRKLGWRNQYNSKEAMDLAIDYLIKHDFS